MIHGLSLELAVEVARMECNVIHMYSFWCMLLQFPSTEVCTNVCLRFVARCRMGAELYNCEPQIDQYAQSETIQMHMTHGHGLIWS